MVLPEALLPFEDEDDEPPVEAAGVPVEAAGVPVELAPEEDEPLFELPLEDEELEDEPPATVTTT